MAERIELTGQRFGQLLVQSYVGNLAWSCRCDCGKTFIALGVNLRHGRTRSCGHTIGANLVRHGKSHLKVYKVWTAMLQRCRNPKVKSYKDYGQRGITVCERWDSFENFYADMGEPDGLTLERKDNSKGYEPGNCKWATRLEQRANSRPRRK